MDSKKQPPKGWLHHATEPSVCLVINSKAYKDALKNGYKKSMQEVKKEREALKEESNKELKTLKVSEMSLKELTELLDEITQEIGKREEDAE